METAPNGYAALEAFSSGDYDVVLINLGMSGMSGDRVAQEMRRADPSVATVLITGWELDADDPRISGIWTFWTLVLPKLAVYLAETLEPTEGTVHFQDRADQLFWEHSAKRQQAFDDYFSQHPIENFNALSRDWQLEIRMVIQQIQLKSDTAFRSDLISMRTVHRNQLRRQQNLVQVLSSISPLSPASFASMDLARTGLKQHVRDEDAVYTWPTCPNLSEKEKHRRDFRCPAERLPIFLPLSTTTLKR